MVEPPPPFDPELAAVLDAIAGGPAPGGTRADGVIPALREAHESSAPPVTVEDLCRDGAFEVTERDAFMPGESRDIPLLACRPTTSAGAVPCLYSIHGGGLIMGDRKTGITGMLDIAEKLCMAVVSVEYRLAPETPYPGPVEDCYAGLAWTARNASELGLDPERIVVAGGSAGGGLAAATALLARDRGGPALAGQLLMCPMLDDRNDSPSALQMAGRGVWDRHVNEIAWTALLGGARGGPGVSGYAAPARAADLSGLPPAYLDVGSAETFRDETVAYASRIWRAGGDAELHVWPGGFHAFAGFAPGAALSRDARDAPVAWLRRLLAR